MLLLDVYCLAARLRAEAAGSLCCVKMRISSAKRMLQHFSEIVFQRFRVLLNPDSGSILNRTPNASVPKNIRQPTISLQLPQSVRSGCLPGTIAHPLA
jgi:hypothetical protein